MDLAIGLLWISQPWYEIVNLCMLWCEYLVINFASPSWDWCSSASCLSHNCVSNSDWYCISKLGNDKTLWHYICNFRYSIKELLIEILVQKKWLREVNAIWMRRMVISLSTEARYDMHLRSELVQQKNLAKISTRCTLCSFKHVETCSGLGWITMGMLIYKVQPLCINEGMVCPRRLGFLEGSGAHD